MLKARDAVSNLPAYEAPPNGREGLRLDLNENTAGCSPRVLAQLRELTPDQIARYAEREPAENAVAGFLGVQPGEVLLTNGVDEAIHLLCETFLEPNDEVLIPVPTFTMYEISAAATGAHVIPVAADPAFRFPKSRLISSISSRTRLIMIANPNNPTGAVASPDDLLEIARCAPNAAILIDEAYFEFYGKTLLPQWRTLPNLFVARTFSKAYGLAGLRIGVLAGAAAHIEMMRRAVSPFNVNGAALACLPTALADQEFVRNYVAEVVAGRQQLQRQLQDRDIPFWPSQANFVLVRFGEQNAAVIEGLRRRGILVRDRSREPGCGGCVRIAIGTQEHTRILIAALSEVLDAISVRRGSAT